MAHKMISVNCFIILFSILIGKYTYFMFSELLLSSQMLIFMLYFSGWHADTTVFSISIANGQSAKLSVTPLGMYTSFTQGVRAVEEYFQALSGSSIIYWLQMCILIQQWSTPKLFFITGIVRAASANDSINIWIIMLPVTGIMLTFLAVIWCLCKNFCKALSGLSSFITKSGSRYEQSIYADSETEPVNV